jgi:hypothetical protein
VGDGRACHIACLGNLAQQLAVLVVRGQVNGVSYGQKPEVKRVGLANGNEVDRV